MKELIKKFLNETHKKLWVIKTSGEIKDYLDLLLPECSSLKERLYFIFNDLNEIPKCPNCGINIPFHTEKGYFKTCSKKCSATVSSKERLEKRKNTCLEKYGVENPMMLDLNQQKRITSVRNKNNGKGNSFVACDKAKSRMVKLNINLSQIIEKKYGSGINNVSKIPGHAEKCVKTFQKNYNTDHYTQSEESKDIKHTQKLKRLYNITNKVHVLTVSDPEIYKMALYNNPNQMVHFKCNICNIEETLTTETFKFRIKNYGTPCGKCSDISNGSLKEKSLYDWVCENYSGTIIKNDRNLIHPKELDILLPDLKIGIEFCGLYWHSQKDKNYHIKKHNLCLEQGYRLITIFEDEWDYQQDIVKHRLMNVLGKSDKKIGARKLKVIELTKKQAETFLKKYHIQNYAYSSIKLGLIDDNQNILSVMTFSSLSKIKGNNPTKNQYELSRFASSINVIGAASKLFNYFIKTYNPEYILSYSDKRWNTGNIYSKIGFTYISDTTPGYWYVKNNIRIHRWILRKKSTDDQTKSEEQLRLEEGYRKIWDCGHSKWEWRNIEK